MSGTGWFAILNLGIWVIATVGVGLTKDSSIYIISGGITILGGLGYLAAKY